jgi:hypothetical protein
MVNFGKTKRLLEVKESQRYNMGFLCDKQCVTCVQEVPPSKMLEEQDGQTWKDHVHNFVASHFPHMMVKLIHL